MDSIAYDIVWPGGNTTAVVRTHVPVTDYVPVAKRILGKNADIEQVGFLLAPFNAGADGRLAMMGGEFCGNATRSAAFLLSRELGRGDVRVEIPGLGEPVVCRVTETQSTIRLPMDFCRSVTPCPEGAVVDLQGIRHVIITEPTAETREALLVKYRDGLPAVGLIYLGKDHAIDPYVWVRDTDTFYHETACGSGSLAAGFVLERREGKRSFVIRQPSGADFSVVFDKTGVELAGPIRLEGTKTMQ